MLYPLSYEGGTGERTGVELGVPEAATRFRAGSGPRISSYASPAAVSKPGPTNGATGPATGETPWTGCGIGPPDLARQVATVLPVGGVILA